MKKSVSIVIPVHNEEKHLASQIKLLTSQLNKNNISYSEIILVENGSTDNTVSVLKKITQKNRRILIKRIAPASYGLAVKHGILSARGNIIVLLNVDFFDINFIQTGLKEIKTYDIVTGSKLHLSTKDSRPLLLQIRTRLLSVILKMFFQFEGTDTHGIKILKNSKALQTTLHNSIAKHEFFDTELIIKLQNKYKELPVQIKEIRQSRYSNWNRIKRSCIDLIRLLFFFLFTKNEQVGKQTIVADDFGISPLISAAILDLAQVNQIDTVSVLANSVEIKDLRKLSKTKAKIAIHLNLVRGYPLSSPETIPTLLNRNTGEFFPLPTFVIKLMLKQIKIEHIKKELEEQINFLKDRKITISEINSEQHTHSLTPILELTQSLAKKHKIGTIRSQEAIEHYLSWRIHKLIVLKSIQFILRKLYPTNVVNQKYVKNRTEIICHPGSSYD